MSTHIICTQHLAFTSYLSLYHSQSIDLTYVADLLDLVGLINHWLYLNKYS